MEIENDRKLERKAVLWMLFNLLMFVAWQDFGSIYAEYVFKVLQVIIFLAMVIGFLMLVFNTGLKVRTPKFRLDLLFNFLTVGMSVWLLTHDEQWTAWLMLISAALGIVGDHINDERFN